MSARLSLRGATVRFGAMTALDHVDLDVEAGEVVVVLGESGSGKSTLLRVIAGLQPLTAGRVLIDGDDVGDTPPHRRGVGLMFQDHALFPHLDVAGNVAFGLRMQGVATASAAARVGDLLDLVGLPGSEGRAIQTLSGGEQQRVALARSLAPEPRALLLDEPLGALDRPLRERLVGDLRRLFGRLGLTVIAVTHDQAEAFSLADRLVLVHAGRVLQSGPPAEVWGAPACAAAARLLGFANVGRAEVRAGRLVGPWGDLGPVEGVATAVVVRPGGVRIDASGAISGRVTATTFAGATTRVEVAVDGAPVLQAEVAAAAAPTVGSVVRVTIDPAAVTALRE